MRPGGSGEGNRKRALGPEKVSESLLEEVTPELSVEEEQTQEGVPSRGGSFFFIVQENFYYLSP